jgi:hypothetical protein
MSDETGSEPPQVEAPETPETPVAPDARRRAPWKRALAVMVAVALVGGGAGAAIALSSSSEGATSPSSAVDALLAAADRSDLLGVLDAIAPGERQVIEPGLTDLVHQLERLGILSSRLDLTDIAGFGLHFSKITSRTRSISSDLAAVTITGGSVSESVNPSELPVGTFLTGLVGGALRGGARTHSSSAMTGASAIVTEKVGGSWYVSLGYTIAFDALRAKGESGVPPSAGAIQPAGTSSADGAVRAFIDDSAAFNISGLISGLAPGEVGALQTYAPEVIGRAESALSKAKSAVQLKVTGMRLSDETVSGGTLVRVSDLGLSASFRGITISIKGGCVAVTAPTGTTSHCPSPTSRSVEEQRILAVLPASLRSLATRLLTTHPDTGIVSVNENGQWFVSPTATLLHDVNAYLAILEPQDLQAIANLARNPAEAKAIARALEQLSLSGVTSGSGLF